MIKQNFIIDELEKKRILNLHESATKKQCLLNEDAGLLKTDFPPCVQDFGEPGKSSDGKYGYISGNKTSKTYNWEGYTFYSNYRVQSPNKTMGYYFCKGNEPILGQKQTTTKGGKTTTEALGGKVLKIGSSGDAVKQVQNRLVQGKHGDGQTVGGNGNCGTDVNSCDGKYGRGTYDAVMKFQKSAGVTADGVVGDETWQQMFGGQAPEQPKTPTNAGGGTKKTSDQYPDQTKTQDFRGAGGGI